MTEGNVQEIVKDVYHHIDRHDADLRAIRKGLEQRRKDNDVLMARLLRLEAQVTELTERVDVNERELGEHIGGYLHT